MASFSHRRRDCIFLFLLLFILSANGRAFAANRQSAALSRYIMGGIYEKQGDIESAIKEYKKSLKADDKNAVVNLSLAAAYIKNKQITPAIEAINRAIALDPDSVEPHAILALLYFSQDKLSAAGKEYERALQNASKLEPGNTGISRSLGILYLQQKDFKSAEQVFRSMIAAAGSDFEAHFYLANALDEQDRREEAVKELKAVISLNPDYHQALNYLGYVYVEENRNLAEAEKLIKKAVEIQPDNGAYVDSLGWLYFRQGKIKEAVKSLEKAAQLLEDPVIYDHLGDAEYKLMDLSAARENWEKSLKMDPEQPEVRKKIESLSKK